MERKYAEFAATKACELLAIDSPSGYTRKAADWVKEAFSSLGFDAQLTTKGGVLVNLGGADEKDALLLEAHTDTLGAMVAEVKANGRLRLTPLGGMRAENAETENVRVHTRTGRIIEGTVQLCNASVHVNGQYGETKRSFDTVEAVLDEDVKTADETRALGVEVGDIVCFEPRTRITSSGYIKSRFLDDKLSVGSIGFANGFVELAEQMDAMGLTADYVYHATGTGGTMAGLHAGRKLVGSQAEIRSITVSPKNDAYLTKVQNLANQVLADLGSDLRVSRDTDLHMDNSYYLPGYEQPNEKASEAIKMLARLEGLFVDPVYTGKALAGLIDHIRTGKVEPGSNVVFWHTGGATALFAEKSMLGDIF